MIINLAFIKAVNGLFYFALDYMAALETETSAVLVRSPALAAAVRTRFPGAPVRIMGPIRAARMVCAASFRGEMVFTPTPHPIPWASRQMVVVHDTYPFEGSRGALKAKLFFLAMRSARIAAGHINVSDGRAFLLQGGIDSARLMGSPNRMAPPATPSMQGGLTVSDRPTIGLFGTDSPKKNYEPLFREILRSAPGVPLSFRLYGQNNPYIAGIIAEFPSLDIQVITSDDMELETFVRSVDILASAATREGFSRPMALALSLGVPCWAVEAPVFREFYGPAVTFHPGVAALADALCALVPGMKIPRPVFTLPDWIERDFQHCIKWLKIQDCPAS